MTYFLLHEKDRHQNNPKEVSLSKNEGKAFLSATWGPRGSGPNNSCALLALTTASRVSLHFASSFHLSWDEMAVLSETLFDFFECKSFRMRETAATSASKKRKLEGNTVATSSVAEYKQKCDLLATISLAWSPFVMTPEHQSMSLIAFSGRQVTTIWGYPCPTFGAPDTQAYLSASPVAWIDTEKHGWVVTSTWKREGGCPSSRQKTEMQLAMGTSFGNVLLATVPVTSAKNEPAAVQECVIDRVIVAPHHQPVFGICLGSANTYGDSQRVDLIVASGSTISVWNVLKKKPQPTKWKAHEGNITGLSIDDTGGMIFSCGIDGFVKVWKKETGVEIPYKFKNPSNDDNPDVVSKYPMFGLTISPNSVQLGCIYIIPPAARPNRRSQADVSYSRVSCALEYLPSPFAKDSESFVKTVCNMLEQNQRVSNFTDILWFCYEDNSATTSLHGSADMALPNLLSKLKGVTMETQTDASRQPLYLSLCEALEARYYSQATDSVPSAVPVFVQASYLLRSSIPPAENHLSIRDAVIPKLLRTLCVYWAERCLNELLESDGQTDNFAAISESERISALMMADYLSVQEPLSAASERLVTTVYSRIGSSDNNDQWSSFLKTKAEATTVDPQSNGVAQVTAVKAPTPPPRQTCFICDQPALFDELEMFCTSGHVQERCFLSFRTISSMDTWKCMGCGASACEIDLSGGQAPFYLLKDEQISDAVSAASDNETKIMCRLCGNYCSFFRY